MVVNSSNKQRKPEGKRHDNPLECEQAEGSPKTNSTQTQKGGCGVSQGKQSPVGSIEVFPTCTEYEQTLAWMWDTQDVKCPPHNR